MKILKESDPNKLLEMFYASFKRKHGALKRAKAVGEALLKCETQPLAWADANERREFDLTMIHVIGNL